MKKFTLTLFTTIILAVVSCSNSNSATEETVVNTTPVVSSSPNIIFILIDDMGWDVFGNYPNITGQKANTPNINALAQNGITFTNFWTNPVCTPTRASILTGKYGFRTGMGGVSTPPTAMKTTETVIQKYINDQTSNKYATALIGKWHVSENNNLTAPESFGINYFSGILTGAISDYYNWTQTSNGKQETITTYSTTQMVNQSISWMNQQSKPFFLWLAFNAPHTPFHRPPLSLITNQSLADNTTAINADKYTYYLAAIEAMDTEIGRLMSSMTTAQKENTVFVIMGDNGTPGQVAQVPYTTNGTKSTLFQGGVNTPLIISGKNVSRKNIVETALIQAQDLFPTFANIAGVSALNYQDGISITPLFTNANATKRTFVYTEQFGQSSPTTDGYTIRNIDYKLIHTEDGTEYLFKLSTDPFETTNLITNTSNTEAQLNLTQLRALKSNL